MSNAGMDISHMLCVFMDAFLKSKRKRKAWIQYPTGIHNVMLHKKYHTPPKSLVLKERSLSHYHMIFHCE